MIPKITTFGACVSRDLFKTSIVREHKNYFNFSDDQYHMSVVSLMSKKISKDIVDSLPGNISGDVNNFVKKCFKEDINKDFLERMKQAQHDYLILDFYMDTFYGVIELSDGSYISGKEWQYKKIDFYNTDISKNVTRVISPLENESEYMSLWKLSIDKFMQFMAEESKDTTVILNCKKFTNRFYDAESGQFSDLSVKLDDKKRNEEVISKLNDIWSRMDNYLIEKFPNVKLLTFTEGDYYSSSDNEWGPFYLHFNQEYYDDASIKIIEIIENDRGYFKLEPVMPGGICKKVDKSISRIEDVREWGEYYLTAPEYAKMMDKPEVDNAGYFLKVEPSSSSGFFIQELTRASLRTSIKSFKRLVTNDSFSEWNSSDISDEVIYLSKVNSLTDIYARGEYYLSDKVSRNIIDHPTKKSGWFLTVGKRTKDSCVQELTKKTSVDENMQKFYRILNFKTKQATKWQEQISIIH